MSVTLRFGSAPSTGAPTFQPGTFAFASSAELVRAAVRHAIAEEIERLVGILDALDGDPDAEPSLGWPEQQIGNGSRFGTADDREDDAGDDREPDDDREPLLGWSEAENQADRRRFGEVWACDDEEKNLQPAVTPPPRPEDEL